MDLAQCRLDENGSSGKATGWHLIPTTAFLTACMRGKGWEPVRDAPAGTPCAERLLAPLNDACYMASAGS